MPPRDAPGGGAAPPKVAVPQVAGRDDLLHSIRGAGVAKLRKVPDSQKRIADDPIAAATGKQAAGGGGGAPAGGMQQALAAALNQRKKKVTSNSGMSLPLPPYFPLVCGVLD